MEGKLNDNISFETAETAIWDMLQEMKDNPLSPNELQRLQNRIEHNLEFAEVTAFHKTVNLGFYELLGDASWINEEGERYHAITTDELFERAKNLFKKENASIIYYKAMGDNR